MITCISALLTGRNTCLVLFRLDLLFLVFVRRLGFMDLGPA